MFLFTLNVYSLPLWLFTVHTVLYEGLYGMCVSVYILHLYFIFALYKQDRDLQNKSIILLLVTVCTKYLLICFVPLWKNPVVSVMGNRGIPNILKLANG